MSVVCYTATDETLLVGAVVCVHIAFACKVVIELVTQLTSRGFHRRSTLLKYRPYNITHNSEPVTDA